MNLRHIEVFHAVYVTGSVSAAARTLNVSQPSVSKVLKHAEARIGFSLFRLVKGRLAPTDEAHALFRDVQEIYGRIESLRETTRNLRRGGEGHIRLAVLPSLALAVAPAAVARFRERRPGVSFEIQTLHNDEIMRALYERNSDLALAYEAPTHPRLGHQVIGSGELVALFRRTDFPDPPPRIAAADLQGREIIALRGADPIGALVSTAFLNAAPEVVAGVTVQTYYVAAALVRHGAGMALVDEFTARASLSPELDFRPLAQPARFQVHGVFLEERAPSGVMGEFVKVIQTALSEGS